MENLAKKLAIYLPHGLEFSGGGDRWVMYSQSKEGAVLLKNGLHDLVVHEANVGDKYKPIMRDISKFGASEQARFKDDCAKPFNGEPNTFLTEWARKIDWLAKNHYDIFGLIPAGFAVDYSTY